MSIEKSFKSRWRSSVLSNPLRTSSNQKLISPPPKISHVYVWEGRLGGMKRELTSGTTDGPSWFNRMKGKLVNSFIVLNQPQGVVPCSQVKSICKHFYRYLAINSYLSSKFTEHGSVRYSFRFMSIKNETWTYRWSLIGPWPCMFKILLIEVSDKIFYQLISRSANCIHNTTQYMLHNVWCTVWI